MEGKEAEENTISHKQINIQFWNWMNRNQAVLNMKNEGGKQTNKQTSKGKETKKVVFCLEISLDHSASRIPRRAQWSC